ncbi:MAG: hypothetical protein ACAI25_18985, partial [Planctomycetota bacterium]
MEGIKVNEARGPTTCAYCHDELDADHVLCGSCGGGLHRDCREALGRCATLGCAGDTARAAAPTVVHVERPPEPTRAPEPARTLGAGRRRYPPRYSSRLQFLRVVLPLLLLGGAFLVVAVAAGTDLSCIAVCLAAISIPAVVMNYVEWSRVRGVDA